MFPRPKNNRGDQVRLRRNRKPGLYQSQLESAYLSRWPFPTSLPKDAAESTFWQIRHALQWDKYPSEKFHPQHGMNELYGGHTMGGGQLPSLIS